MKKCAAIFALAAAVALSSVLVGGYDVFYGETAAVSELSV